MQVFLGANKNRDLNIGLQLFLRSKVYLLLMLLTNKTAEVRKVSAKMNPSRSKDPKRYEGKER